MGKIIHIYKSIIDSKTKYINEAISKKNELHSQKILSSEDLYFWENSSFTSLLRILGTSKQNHAGPLFLALSQLLSRICLSVCTCH